MRRHSPVGNSVQFGELVVIMRPSYVRDAMLITPQDSAQYVRPYPNCPHWPNCTAGTLDHSIHILKAWMLQTGYACMYV